MRKLLIGLTLISAFSAFGTEATLVQGAAGEKLFNNLPNQRIVDTRMQCTTDVPASYCETITVKVGSVGDMSYTCTSYVSDSARYSCLLE